jgi:hypothetical protein
VEAHCIGLNTILIVLFGRSDKEFTVNSDILAREKNINLSIDLTFFYFFTRNL